MRLLVGVLIAVGCYAQQFVVVGAGVNTPASPQVTGYAAYAKPIGAAGTFSYSSVALVANKPSTVETGIAQRIISQGPFSLYGLGTAGAAVGGDNVGAAFSGGGFVSINLDKWLHNCRALVGVKALKTSLSNVTPQVVAGFAWGF